MLQNRVSMFGPQCAWATSALLLSHDSHGRVLVAQARGVWVRLPVAASLFTFLYFCLITSKFIHFQHEARCSEDLEWEIPLSMGSFLMERIFWLTPNRVLTAHTEWLPGVRLRHSVPPACAEGCDGWWLSSCQWQSTGGSSQRYPGFDSRRLSAFSLSSISHNI